MNLHKNIIPPNSVIVKSERACYRYIHKCGCYKFHEYVLDRLVTDFRSIRGQRGTITNIYYHTNGSVFYEVNVDNKFVFIGHSGLRLSRRINKKPRYIDTLRGKKQRLECIRKARRAKINEEHGPLVGPIINAGMSLTESMIKV